MPRDDQTGFLQDEGGAVTIDWVILTGSLITMALLVVGGVRSGTSDLSTGTGAQLAAAQVAGIGALGFAD